MIVRALVKISGYFTHQHALVRPYGNDRAPRLKKPELLQRMIQAVIPRRLPVQPIIYEGKNVQLTDNVHDRPISIVQSDSVTRAGLDEALTNHRQEGRARRIVNMNKFSIFDTRHGHQSHGGELPTQLLQVCGVRVN